MVLICERTHTCVASTCQSSCSKRTQGGRACIGVYITFILLKKEPMLVDGQTCIGPSWHSYYQKECTLVGGYVIWRLQYRYLNVKTWKYMASLTLIPPSGGIYGSQFLVVKLLEEHKCYWNETSIYSSSFLCSFMIFLLNFLKTTLSVSIFIWNVQNSESVSSIYPQGGWNKCLISRKLVKRWITS